MAASSTLGGASLAILLLSCGAACAPGTAGDPLAPRSGAIIGGTADTTHDAVLALVQYETPTRGFACSGTAIVQSGTSAFLLTAAHCLIQRDAMDQAIQPMTIAPPSVLTVVQGPEWKTSLSIGRNFAVAAVAIAPGYDGAPDSPNDLAIVRFVTPPGTALPVIPILEAADDALAVGSVLTMVGYGVTVVGGENSLRRTVDLPIDSLNAQHLFYLENNMKAPCSGDSGGPDLIRLGGAERVAGVFSYSLDVPSLDLFCAFQGVSVRVSSFTAFIHSVVGGTATDAGTSDARPPTDTAPASDAADAATGDARAQDAAATDTARDAGDDGSDAASAPDGASPGSDGSGPDSTATPDAGGADADAARMPDAATAADAGSDASADGRGEPPPGTSGCGCAVGDRSTSTSTWGTLAGLLAVVLARRRTRWTRPTLVSVLCHALAVTMGALALNRAPTARDDADPTPSRDDSPPLAISLVDAPAPLPAPTPSPTPAATPPLPSPRARHATLAWIAHSEAPVTEPEPAPSAPEAAPAASAAGEASAAMVLAPAPISAPAPAPSEPEPVPATLAVELAAAVASTPLAPPGTPGAEGIRSDAAAATSGAGTGDGAPSDGGMGHGGRRRRRPLELFGRVVGGSRGCIVPAHADRPCISLKESTALRARDHFPRLPAALWPDPRPYVVRAELCVAADGAVSDAVLLSRESERFDGIVLDAVRTWRYRPRLSQGNPAPFCHAVVIQFESP